MIYFRHCPYTFMSKVRWILAAVVCFGVGNPDRLYGNEGDAGVVITPLEHGVSFDEWIGWYGVGVAEQPPHSNPENDGVENLLKFAFVIPLMDGTRLGFRNRISSWKMEIFIIHSQIHKYSKKIYL